MNKPLTVDELKALKDGDWVWVELKDKFTLKCNNVVYDYKCSNTNRYFQVSKIFNDDDGITILVPYEDYSLRLLFSDYGNRWLAYKNKEQYISKELLQEILGFIGSNQKFCIVDNEHKTLINVDELFDFISKLANEYGIVVE